MPPHVAAAAFALGILGLFWLDRHEGVKTSRALWIPCAWLFLNGSRQVSLWLQMGPTVDSAEKYLDGSPLDAAFYGALVAAALVVMVGRRRELISFLRANGPIILFLSYCAISTLWSDYTFVALKRWTKELGDIVMVLVVLTDPQPTVALKRVMARMGFLLLPISVLFIKYFPDLGRTYNIWTWTPMFCGITTTKNGLGMICLVYGMGCLWCFLTAYGGEKGRERTRHMIAHGIVLAAAAWLLWRCNSMTSIACLVLGGGLMAMTSQTRIGRKPAIVHLTVLVIVCLSFTALFLGGGGAVLETMGRDATLTGRTDIWSIVLSVAANPLVGAGFESFWLGDRLEKVWQIFGLHINEAHNGYLEVYLNLGWIGVAILAGLIVTGYRNVIRALRENQAASSLRLAFFVSAILYSYSEAGFRMMSPIWTAFLLAIIAVPNFSAPEVEPEPQAESLPEDADLALERDYISTFGSGRTESEPV